MKKVPCIKSDDCHYLLLKDYQDFSGWVILIISKNDIFTKADKRIKGDAKMAEETFKKIYSYKAEFSYKTLKEII
jgi:hypothetical protein